MMISKKTGLLILLLGLVLGAEALSSFRKDTGAGEGSNHGSKVLAAAGAKKQGGTKSSAWIIAAEKIGTMAAPMSPTMQCVINLTAQYFVLFLLVQIAKTYNQRMQDEASKTQLEKIFEAAIPTVKFCPMLAILFLAMRMRATQLRTVPPVWAQQWMYIVCYCVLAQTILELLGKWVVMHNFSAGFKWLLKVADIGCTVGIYMGFTMVILAIFALESAKGNPNCPDCNSYTPPVAPAVQCTISLATQYFSIYLFLKVFQSWNAMMNHGQVSPWERILRDAIHTVDFCPMLAVLFIGARMRALQIDPRNGAPQVWAQGCFFLCTYALLTQTLMAILTPVMSGSTNAVMDEKGHIAHKHGEISPMAYITAFIKYFAMICLYGGTVAVLYSIVIISAPPHLGIKTPEISPAMQCVMNLTCQYFFLFLLLESVKAYSEFVLDGERTNALTVVEAALPTVALIPMMSILFVGVRLRALELDPYKGSPQKWAQTWMFLSTYAVGGQTLLSLIGPFVSGELHDPNQEEDAPDAFAHQRAAAAGQAPPAEPEPKPDKGGGWAFWAVTVLKFLFMVVVYAGAVTILYSTFVIEAPPGVR